MATFRSVFPHPQWQGIRPPNMVYPFIPPQFPVLHYRQMPPRHVIPHPVPEDLPPRHVIPHPVPEGLRKKESMKPKLVDSSVQTDPVIIQPCEQKQVEIKNSETQTFLNDLLEAQKRLRNANLPLNASLDLQKFFQKGTRENKMYRTVFRDQLALLDDYEALDHNDMLMDITIDKVIQSCS